MLQRGDNVKLQDCTLFKNTRIDTNNINIVQFPNRFTIALEGDLSTALGIVLEGKIHIKAYSLGGKNFTLNTLNPGQLFGDVLIYGSQEKSYPGNLITQGETKVAFIPNNEFQQFLYNDHDLLKNFLSVLSEKAYEMNINSKLLSQESIRDKIIFYLQQEKRKQKKQRILLNMTKEELANKLFIQRPSLSRELSNMKTDGLIDYDRNSITLL